MPRPELGKKYTCSECDTKFYDLNRAEVACPNCGWNPDAGETVSKAKRSEPEPEAIDEEVESVVLSSDDEDEDDDDVEEITLDEDEGVKRLMETAGDDDDRDSGDDGLPDLDDDNDLDTDDEIQIDASDDDDSDDIDEDEAED